MGEDYMEQESQCTMVSVYDVVSVQWGQCTMVRGIGNPTWGDLAKSQGIHMIIHEQTIE